MLWLIILGVAVCLLIALRRVRSRQAPLSDELYSKRVAVDHVHSGVAWVRADGTFGSVNDSFARAFDLVPKDFAGREWYKVFRTDDHARVRDAYSQMMLMGIVAFEASTERVDGSRAWLNVRLVAVHDHSMRLVGHHCLVEDKTREHDLQQQVQALEKIIARQQTDGSDTQTNDRSVLSILNRARDGARLAKRESVSPIAVAG